MYTQCRGCGEVFVIDVDHLIHARGHVRCNLCGTVFDGMETLSADKPHEDEDLLLHDFDNAPPLLTQAFHAMLVADSVEEDIEDEFAEDIAAELDGIIAEAVADSAADTSEDMSEDSGLPGFVIAEESVVDVPFVAEKRAQQKPKTSNLLWSGLAAAMLCGLLWQAQAAIASGQVKLPEHPISERLCEWFSCAKAADDVDLNAISLVSRNIRPHPGRDESLIISASMINANESNQKFPALEIKLSDLNGQIVAMRRFIADEYVPVDVLRAGFVANTLIPINLEIVSPGEDAVAFEIGFVQP
ncbi:hypothetical protein MNBD_GAMMA02-730 [hydrothermal vent metagenome]|uniref:C2H2-type domain-containing protein n=1 Tax=hydrothermal vent metagenome TaxID=652676 RepID=A0A3B0VM33_9ZZZZ